MKRTGFKKKLKQSKVANHRVKTKLQNKGYKIPNWYKKLPYKSSDHGNNAVQKRCWRVVSQTFREYDFLTYGAQCPICNTKFSSWQEGQLGHWLRYSLCNGFFKYERLNLSLICAGCNFKDDAVTLRKLGETLQTRHGADVLTYIEIENQRQRGMKLENWMFVDYVQKLRPDLAK